MFAIVNGVEIPEYYGKPYVEIGKKPFFSEDEKKNGFCAKQEKRIGSFNIDNIVYPIYTVYACIDIEHISGKRNKRNDNKNLPAFFYRTYDLKKEKYVFNNCHLIGYQLTGDNSKENLIIGTRYMNEIGMLHFETIVKDYVENTGKHVLYRVTPVFNENEQLIRGVQIEASSLEDEGLGISFNVFVYNVQPEISINYENCDDNKKDDEWCSRLFTGNNMYTDEEKGTQDYVLNINTRIFHKPNCNCNNPDQLKTDNRIIFKWPKKFLEDNGCKPCGNCKP